MNRAIKGLFETTARYNVSLHHSYIPTDENLADSPSRRLSMLDCMLTPSIWKIVQSEFGGEGGHSCDLMSLDSNVMTDFSGSPLPHFSSFFPISLTGSSSGQFICTRSYPIRVYNGSSICFSSAGHGWTSPKIPAPLSPAMYDRDLA